jgi:hypothetical protein
VPHAPPAAGDCMCTSLLEPSSRACLDAAVSNADSFILHPASNRPLLPLLLLLLLLLFCFIAGRGVHITYR